MYIVHVFIEVKPDFIEAFKAVSLTNAMASVREPGIARFDVLQDAEQPGISHWLKFTAQKMTLPGTGKRNIINLENDGGRNEGCPAFKENLR